MERWRKKGIDQVWKGRNVLDIEKGWDKKQKQKDKMELVSSLLIGESVLDVGCGTGDLYKYLKNVDYVGVDQSGDMLERARIRNPSASFIQKNLYELDLPQFDTVVCLDVLHHQPDLEPGFSALLKHARKCLLVTLWINDRDEHHPRQIRGSMGELITWFTEEELKEKFSGLLYEVYEGVGCPWKDLYRFILTARAQGQRIQDLPQGLPP